MCELAGKWRHVRDENFNKYLSALGGGSPPQPPSLLSQKIRSILGVGFLKRKVVENLHPDVTITVKDGKWSIRTVTSLSDQTVEFTIGEQYKTNVKGLVEGMMECLATYEDGQLRTKADPTDEADIKATVQSREIKDGEMMQTMTCENVTCRRFFKRLEPAQ